MQIDECYPTITTKEKNDVEILNFDPPTYSVNTLKFEYLGLCTPRVVHNLNLVVWQ
jgi:hypothetical protein